MDARKQFVIACGRLVEQLTNWMLDWLHKATCNSQCGPIDPGNHEFI